MLTGSTNKLSLNICATKGTYFKSSKKIRQTDMTIHSMQVWCEYSNLQGVVSSRLGKTRAFVDSIDDCLVSAYALLWTQVLKQTLIGDELLFRNRNSYVPIWPTIRKKTRNLFAVMGLSNGCI